MNARHGRRVGVGGGRPGRGGVLAWTAIRQDREFQRLIAAGDAALAQDQTFVAIEAFSGALALKRDSMLAYLKRGDTYRRRGELAAALRDLRAGVGARADGARARWSCSATSTPRMGRYERAIEQYRRFIRARRPRAARPLQAGAHLLPRRPGRAGHRAAAAGAGHRRPAGRGALPARHVPARERRQPDALTLAAPRARAQSRRSPRHARSWRCIYAALRPRPREHRAARSAGRARARHAPSAWSASAWPTRAWAAPKRRSSRWAAPPSAIPTTRRSTPRSAACGSKRRRAATTASRSSKALEALQPPPSAPTPPAKRWRSTAARCCWRATPTPPSARCSRRPSALPVEPLAYLYLADAAASVSDSSIARHAELRYGALNEP